MRSHGPDFREGELCAVNVGNTKLRTFTIFTLLRKSCSSSDAITTFVVLQLAKKYHPDTNQDDPQAKEKFSKLAEAYEVRFKEKTHINAFFNLMFGY